MSHRPDMQAAAEAQDVQEPWEQEELLTDELLGELLSAPDPETYLQSHKIPNRSLSDYLQQLLQAHGLAQSKVVRAAQLDSTYGYQLFTGSRKNPKRDKVLAIAFAMGLSLDDANRLLQVSGNSSLYCKNRRDAIVIFALEHGYSLQRANETLFKFGEQAIEPTR